MIYPVTIAIIDGSPRKESHTRTLALKVSESLSVQGARTKFFDQRENQLPLFDDEPRTEQHPAVQVLFETLEEADAVVLSSPEYHGSISGALKNALDWLSRKPESSHKEMLLCGLIGGGGAMGNSGALIQMMMAVRSMKWWLMPDALVSISNIWGAFDGQKLKDPDLQRRVDFFSRSLIRQAARFRAVELGA